MIGGKSCACDDKALLLINLFILHVTILIFIQLTSPFYPQSDGLVERLFRTVKLMISATIQRHRISWCQALPFVEMGLRCSIQSSTRFSPYEILFGKKMSLPLCWKYPLPLAEDRSTVNSNKYLHELNENLQWIHTQVMKNADLAASQQKAY